MDFLALLQKVGFEKTELVGETGFNSTPKTRGVLLRAEKPASSIQQQAAAETIPNVLKNKVCG